MPEERAEAADGIPVTTPEETAEEREDAADGIPVAMPEEIVEAREDAADGKPVANPEEREESAVGRPVALGTGTVGSFGTPVAIMPPVEELKAEVNELTPDATAGKLPVPLPFGATQPLTGPTFTQRLEATGA